MKMPDPFGRRSKKTNRAPAWAITTSPGELKPFQGAPGGYVPPVGGKKMIATTTQNPSTDITTTNLTDGRVYSQKKGSPAYLAYDPSKDKGALDKATTAGAAEALAARSEALNETHHLGEYAPAATLGQTSFGGRPTKIDGGTGIEQPFVPTKLASEPVTPEQPPEEPVPARGMGTPVPPPAPAVVAAPQVLDPAIATAMQAKNEAAAAEPGQTFFGGHLVGVDDEPLTRRHPATPTIPAGAPAPVIPPIAVLPEQSPEELTPLHGPGTHAPTLAPVATAATATPQVLDPAIKFAIAKNKVGATNPVHLRRFEDDLDAGLGGFDPSSKAK